MPQDNIPANLLTQEQRMSPQMSNIDQNTAQVLANAGYSNLSLPPGMTANPNLDSNGMPIQVTQPQVQPVYQGPVTPGNASQEYVEYSSPVNLNAMLPQQQQMSAQDAANGAASIVGRNSPYTVKAQQQIQQQEVQQPVPVQANNTADIKPGFIVGGDGQLRVLTPEEEGALKKPEDGQHPQMKNFNTPMTPTEVLASLQDPKPQTPVAQQQPQQVQQQVPAQQQQVQDPVIAAELARLKAENDVMKGYMSQSQNQQQTANNVPEKVSESPKLETFTKDLRDKDKWVPEESLNPSTDSGRAFTRWMAERDVYLLEQAQTGMEANIYERESAKVTQIKSAELAQAYPEFLGFDNQPNLERIKGFFDNLINETSWSKLKQAIDLVNNTNQVAPQVPYQNGTNAPLVPQMNNSMRQMMTPPTNGIPLAPAAQPILQAQPQQVQQFVNQTQVGQQAARIVPINTGGSPSLGGEAPRVPESITKLQKIYGNNFELPTNSIIR